MKLFFTHHPPTITYKHLVVLVIHTSLSLVAPNLNLNLHIVCSFDTNPITRVTVAWTLLLLEPSLRSHLHLLTCYFLWKQLFVFSKKSMTQPSLQLFWVQPLHMGLHNSAIQQVVSIPSGPPPSSSVPLALTNINRPTQPPTTSPKCLPPFGSVRSSSGLGPTRTHRMVTRN